MPKLTLRELLKLAIPSMLFAVLTNAYRSVDQYWIQGVSTEAQAAIGSSVFVLITFFSFFYLVAGGAGPLVARATGAGDDEERRTLVGAGIFGAFCIAVLLSLVGTFGAGPLSRALGLQGQTAVECEIYIRTLSLTMLPLVFTPLVDNSFISMGNARLPLLLHAASLALNICLTPLFIFGADLGIAGAALASNLSRGLTTGAGIYFLARKVDLRWADIRPGTQLRRICLVGWPITVGIATYSLVYWGIMWTSISPLGPQENAALGIGFSALEGFTWPCFHGLAMACASFVGRYLGAGRPDMARATLRLAMPVATVLGTAATLAFFLGGEFLTGLFTSDPAVHEAATRYAVILAASQIFVAWESLFEGILTGAGATRIVFWLSLPFNVLRIPLAWFLAFPLGWKAAGIWWAINLSTLLKAGAKGLVVYRGRWEDTEI